MKTQRISVIFDNFKLWPLIVENDLNGVKTLIESGVGFEETASSGKTLLMQAIEFGANYGDFKITEYLLNKSPKDLITAHDKRGFSLIHYAALGCNENVSKWLVAKEWLKNNNFDLTEVVVLSDVESKIESKIESTYSSQVNIGISSGINKKTSVTADNLAYSCKLF